MLEARGENVPLSFLASRTFLCLWSFLQLQRASITPTLLLYSHLCRARCLKELTCSLELVSFAEKIRGTYRRQLLADHQGEMSAKLQAELCRDLNTGVSGQWWWSLGTRWSRHLAARGMDELSRWEVTLGRMAELEGTGV